MNKDNEQFAALYIRVSTDMQTELSPDAQKRELIKYAKEHGYTVLEEFIFIEEGVSGKKADKRPEFQRMIATAKLKPRPFDAVLVWKFSRFARNQDESTFYKSILRKKCGIDVISISEPIIEGMFGRLMEMIIEWNDEYYSYNLSGEVMRGMTERALRGGFQGGPPLGYTLQDNKLIIIPEEAKLIKYIYDQYLYNGKSPFAIARDLNEKGFKSKRGNNFSKRTVTYILKNPTYIAKIRWNRTQNATHTIKPEDEWVVADGAHEPIISQEMFDAVAEKLIQDNKKNQRKKSRSADTYSHWLSGIVRCSDCGKVLVATHAYKNKTASIADTNKCGFQCYAYSKGLCLVSHYITAEKLSNALFSSLEAVINSRNIEFEVPSRQQLKLDDTASYLSQLDKLKIKEKRIKDAYINEIDTLEEYKENKKRLSDERMRIQKLIDSTQEPNSSNPENKQRMLHNVKTTYDLLKSDNVDLVTKNTALKNIISKIVFDKKNNRLDIYYYLSNPLI